MQLPLLPFLLLSSSSSAFASRFAFSNSTNSYLSNLSRSVHRSLFNVTFPLYDWPTFLVVPISKLFWLSILGHSLVVAILLQPSILEILCKWAIYLDSSPNLLTSNPAVARKLQSSCHLIPRSLCLRSYSLFYCGKLSSPQLCSLFIVAVWNVINQ